VFNLFGKDGHYVCLLFLMCSSVTKKHANAGSSTLLCSDIFSIGLPNGGNFFIKNFFINYCKKKSIHVVSCGFM